MHPQSGAQTATNFIEARDDKRASRSLTTTTASTHTPSRRTFRCPSRHNARRSRSFPGSPTRGVHYLGLDDPGLLLSTPSDRSHAHNIIGAIGNATDVYLYLVAPTNVMRTHTASLGTLLHNDGFGPAQF